MWSGGCSVFFEKSLFIIIKIDVLQSRPSAGGHKILNFTSKMLDLLAVKIFLNVYI
eukprot:UN20618